MPGPSTKPTPNAAPISPKLAARFSGGVTSEMYAPAVLKLAAVMPGNHPADQQPPEIRRQRHENEVQTQSCAGNEDHGAPSEVIRERTLHRREDELHQRPGGAEQPVHLRGARRVAAHEVLHQHGQHRNDHAEGQHVDEHGDEDEGQRGLARGDESTFMRASG